MMRPQKPFTLAFVLVELSKMLAPFMPFLADFIYKDLTGQESVHLTSVWGNFRFELTSEKMDFCKWEQNSGSRIVFAQGKKSESPPAFSRVLV